MPVFGAHAYIWVAAWSEKTSGTAIESAARAGVDLIEIPLLKPAEFNAKLTRQQLGDYGLKGSCSLVLPADAHMPEHPREARDFLHLALDTVAELGGDFLSGVLYGHLGYLTGAPPTEKEQQTCAEVLAEVAHYAGQRNITLGLEPCNRYETYLYNTIGDTLGLIDAIGSNRVFVHADTYHMNIEEPGFKRPVLEAGDKLAYLHCSESDRGVPGQGNVHWDELFSALAAISYGGPLVLESFAAINPDLLGATCMWRKTSYTSDQLATEGLEFLRDKAARVGLV